MAASDWTREEAEACVADYLRMLALELNGQQYSKAEHRRQLMTVLNGRSEGSIEFKHQNISAVLLELGYPYIDGYKPAMNYQQLLFEVVEQQLSDDPVLAACVVAAVNRPAVAVPPPTVDTVFVPAPMKVELTLPGRRRHRFSPVQRDYLLQEARNRSLGLAGEVFVVDLERRRLRQAGLDHLAAQVENVAQTQGDGVGFDVRSFDLSGREQLIEVKTTSFGQMTPFFVTTNELARSRVDHDSYRLYRVFNFRNAPRVYDVPGALDETCQLEASTYLARLA